MIILALIPLFVFMFSVAAEGEKGFLHVILVQTNPNDEISTNLIEELTSEPSVVMFSLSNSAEEMSKYRETLSEDPHLKTGIMNCGAGSVFFCEELGAAMLKKQKDEVFSSEGSSRVLDMLGDEGFRKLVRHLFKEKYGTMTIGSTSKMLTCETDTARNYLETLKA